MFENLKLHFLTSDTRMALQSAGGRSAVSGRDGMVVIGDGLIEAILSKNNIISKRLFSLPVQTIDVASCAGWMRENRVVDVYALHYIGIRDDGAKYCSGTACTAKEENHESSHYIVSVYIVVIKLQATAIVYLMLIGKNLINKKEDTYKKYISRIATIDLPGQSLPWDGLLCSVPKYKKYILIARIPGHLYSLDHDPHSSTFKIVTHLGNILYVLCRDGLSRWLSRGSGLLDSLILSAACRMEKRENVKKNTRHSRIRLITLPSSGMLQKTRVSKFEK
ncbi:hypothetical protein QTP88_022343 [Uroleucon formosanum]